MAVFGGQPQFLQTQYPLVLVVQLSTPQVPISGQISALRSLPAHIRMETSGRWEEGSGNSEPLRSQAFLLLSGFTLIPEDLIIGKPSFKQTL